MNIERFPNSHRSTPRLTGGNGSVRPGNSPLPAGRSADLSTPFVIRKSYPGLDQVLSEMKRLVTEYKGNPDVRDKAVAITAGIPRDIRTGLPDRRNYQNIASAVYDWMKKNIEYVRDPAGIEWLQTPKKTLEIGYGDCDDQSMLAGALLSSIGVPTRFKVVKADASKPDAYSHVFLEYQADGNWKPFDPTLHSKAGDGLSDSRIFGSRTVALSDGLGCSSCGKPGLSDAMQNTNWKLLGGILLAGAFAFSYFNRRKKE